VTCKVEDLNRRLLRARDAMDRAYAEPLDVRTVAAVACLSEAQFIRSFRVCFGETPHRYRCHAERPCPIYEAYDGTFDVDILAEQSNTR